MAKTKFYVVWVGNKTGVFYDWGKTQEATNGVKGAKFKSFPSESAAKSAFADGHELHYGINTKDTKEKKEKTKTPKGTKKLDIPLYLTVDAAFNGTESEWRGVMCGQGLEDVEVFRSPIYSGGSNNIGEFLALIQGISYLIKNNQLHVPIYSDSKTAISWHTNKAHKCTVLDNPKNSVEMIDKFNKSFDFLKGSAKKHSYVIEKWHTKAWGEIAADFGRK
jgi:ribonuclease HI